MQQQNKYQVVKNIMKSAGHSNRNKMNLKYVIEESKENGTQNADLTCDGEQTEETHDVALRNSVKTSIPKLLINKNS